MHNHTGSVDGTMQRVANWNANEEIGLILGCHMGQQQRRGELEHKTDQVSRKNAQELQENDSYNKHAKENWNDRGRVCDLAIQYKNLV